MLGLSTMAAITGVHVIDGQSPQAVLREGTDYGHHPRHQRRENTLWRPGAQKLLQWFRLECTCERIEIERDDDGRKHGITYRAEVGRRPQDGNPRNPRHLRRHRRLRRDKFHQTAEEVQRKAKDRRPSGPEGPPRRATPRSGSACASTGPTGTPS